jgi:hypothetical protein
VRYVAALRVADTEIIDYARSVPDPWSRGCDVAAPNYGPAPRYLMCTPSVLGRILLLRARDEHNRMLSAGGAEVERIDGVWVGVLFWYSERIPAYRTATVGTARRRR